MPFCKRCCVFRQKRSSPCVRTAPSTSSFAMKETRDARALLGGMGDRCEFESPARTVTESDIVMYAGLSGDYNPLHINEEYAKQTQFGTRIAHGPLVYGIATGLLFHLNLSDDTRIAFLG